MPNGTPVNRLLRAAICTLSLASASTQAALVSLAGDGFSVLYDDATSGAFGAPTLAGDRKTILFSPNRFEVHSSGTQGLSTGRAAITFDIVPVAGKRLNWVNVIEAGDYRVVDRNPDLDPSPGVDVRGTVQLTNLYDGVSSVQKNLAKASPLDTVCPDISCIWSSWSANARIWAPASWSNGTPGLSSPPGPTPLRFALEDELSAQSFALGDSAVIQKKQASNTITIGVNLNAVVTPVPLPGTLALLLPALGGLAARRRRVRGC